jgi:hypothetical protein
MIFGRPTNLWTGLVVSTLGLIQIILVQGLKYDPVNVSLLLGAIGVVLGSIIGLVANQSPTVRPGDTVTVVTPSSEPNREVTIS